MKIELFYLEGCPNVEPTVQRLRQVLQERGLEVPISEINVSDERKAREVRFLGSPTIRIDGLDIEPSARGRSDFGIMCRTYDDGGRVPSGIDPGRN